VGKRVARAWGALLCLALAACSQQPPLKIPSVPVASAYREAAAWAPAQAADTLPREAWWTLYGDAELNQLQQRLIKNSPDLAAALARYQQSRAVTEQINASQFPTLSASLNSQRDRQSEKRPLRVLGPLSPNDYSSSTLGLDLEYEVDLWGRVRSLVASGQAQDQAAQADLESARLGLQAQLADSYMALRGLDRDAALLSETEAAYAKALALVTRRHDGGLASGLDQARAQAQLEATRSQLQQSQAQRALIEHAIASLVGESASAFSLQPSLSDIALPRIPVGLPSHLLQRRADIAAAERRVAASNASVGVAQAAFFPVLTLSALGGYQSSALGNFLRAPNSFWAIGPTLFLNLFDAGKRNAEEARVRAVLDESGAKYRAVVIGAFQQVEDNLALLQRYDAAARSETAALAAAQRALELANSRYREGGASYLEVVASQTAALQAQRSALDLATRQRRASVQLIRALGGGWSASTEAHAQP
jgi:NodT family efflux transporter outer membrane factor (OMF) lipoprotein